MLQTFGECAQTPVEGWRVIPKTCVPRVRHHLNLRVSYGSLVLIDGGWSDNRVISTMANQDRLTDFR